MKISDITQWLEQWAPLSLQESYDNCGLLIGDPEASINRALVSIDCTVEVLEEARRVGANLVISHHPLIFTPLKSIGMHDPVGKAVSLAMRENIAVYAAHTNVDHVKDGVNFEIAQRLGLRAYQILSPENLDQPDAGSGAMGFLESPLAFSDFLHLVKQVFTIPVLRYSKTAFQEVQKIAICGGSGGFLINNALKAGCHVLVTADLTYHKFFEGYPMAMVDAGHYETEQYTTALIVKKISEKFPTFAIRISETVTNPINYLF